MTVPLYVGVDVGKAKNVACFMGHFPVPKSWLPKLKTFWLKKAVIIRYSEWRPPLFTTST